MKYGLTIDQGTTSTKVLVFDEEGNVVYKTAKTFPTIYEGECILHDPERIYEDVVELCCEVLHLKDISVKDILGVGITNQRETTVLWDKVTMKPIYPAIVWQSTQSKEICEEWKQKKYEDIVWKKTGLLINPYFSASKIRWILDHVSNAESLMKENRLLFGTMDSWLVYRLTNGKYHITDYTNASRTMLFNIYDLCWDKELLSLFSISETILPKVVNCNERIGLIEEERIKRLADLEICAIAGDQQASLFGHTCFTMGDVKITYGTGSFMLLNTGKHPALTKTGLLTTIAYVLDGKPYYALEGSVFVAGSAFAFIKDNLGIVDTLDDTEFEDREDNSLVFVPALTGLGAPYWNADCRGAMFGLTRNTSKKDMAWATLEGVSFLNKDVLDCMTEATQMPLRSISVDGGASFNRRFMQFQSSIMKQKIQTISTVEATALGVFYLVGLSKGLFHDLEDIRKLYRAKECYLPQEIKNLDFKTKRWKRAISACMEFENDK